MTKGIIFNIQKFSIHDGPGIRTTVFLKGCPLRCKWCANPESQETKIQILHDNKKCVRCQKCVHICPAKAITLKETITIDSSKCIGCLQCVNNCPAKALSHEGDYTAIDEIVEKVMQDKDFYEESGGGVTISGGEGMSQPEFLKELLTRFKENNLHTAIETTGYIEENTFHELANMLDLLLFDVKQYDSDQHYAGTNVHNELIIKNLKWALDNSIEVLPRIPVIPGFNNTLEDAKGFSKLFNEIGVTKVQLLPFHQFGERKYELMHKAYAYKDVKQLRKEDLLDYQQIFLDHNINCFF